MWRAQITEFNQNLSCWSPHLLPIVAAPSLLTHHKPSSHSNWAKSHRNHEHSCYAHPVSERPCHRYRTILLLQDLHCMHMLRWHRKDMGSNLTHVGRLVVTFLLSTLVHKVHRSTWKFLSGPDPWNLARRHNLDYT